MMGSKRAGKASSGFVSKEEAEAEVKATRVETAASVPELVELAKADDVKEMHMEGVDMGDPANLSRFDIDFCSAVAKCRGVQVLGVTYGQMEPGSAHRLATGISHHASLRRLYLRGNSIKTEGVNLMAQQLKGNTVLRFLELDENGIGPDFPMALVKALPSLEKLNLYGNAIRSLPEVLLDQPPTKLEDLDLRANGLDEESLSGKVPARWMINHQRDAETLKQHRIRRRVTLY